MSLLYSMKEGLAGFRRARFATMASMSAIVVALTLIGALGIMGFHAEKVIRVMRTQSGEVEVFLLHPDESRADSLRKRLAAQPGVVDTRFISQLEAEAIFRSEFGEDGNVFMGEHFLPASIKIRMAASYAHVDSLNRLVATIGGWENVDEVVFNQPLLLRLQENLRLTSTIALAIGLLVLLASVILVANTIRLTIYARRLLIRTMKLVGATDAFVRRPFLFEGIYQGLVAGLVSAGLVVLLHEVLLRFVPLLDGWPGGHPAVVAAALLLLGLLLGFLGSLVATRRFIRKVHLH